jgi:glycosyltransferase involved in cell wall biosynthesis
MSVIWHIYPGTVGNAGAYIDTLQRVSKKAGIESCAFVSRYYEFSTEGVIKYFFPVTDGIMQRNKLLTYLRGIELVMGNLFIWFIALFRRPIINIHMAGYFPPTFMLFCLCRAIGLRTYVTCHDVAECNLRMSKYRLFMLQKANKLIVHSQAAQKMLLHYLGKFAEKRVVRYPFPFSSYDSILREGKMTDAAEELNSILGKNADYFLFLGPRECKGITTIIEAWKIADCKRRCKLFVAGKWGDVPEGTQEKIATLENCVVLSRYLTNEEFVCFIANARFVLLPYLDYSHSSVLISCAKHNGAVIISDIDLFKDYLRNYDLTFPKGDIKALAAVIEKAAEMPENEVKLRAKCLKEAVEQYDRKLPEEIIRAYKDI